MSAISERNSGQMRDIAEDVPAAEKEEVMFVLLTPGWWERPLNAPGSSSSVITPRIRNNCAVHRGSES